MENVLERSNKLTASCNSLFRDSNRNCVVVMMARYDPQRLFKINSFSEIKFK